MMAYNARSLGTTFETAIFLFQGASDLQRRPDRSRDYLATPEAPTYGRVSAPAMGERGDQSSYLRWI